MNDWSVTHKGTPPPFKQTLYIVKISQEEGFTTLLVAVVQADQAIVVEDAMADIILFLPHKVVVQNSNVNFVAVVVILRFIVGIVLMKISLNQPYLRPKTRMMTPTTTLFRQCLWLLQITWMILGIRTSVLPTT